MEIEPAESDGGKFKGASIRHSFKEQPTHSSKMGMQMAYQEPEMHSFGEGEGHEMLAHIANHLGIAEGKEQEAPEAQSKDETEDV
jgi:hypothetical protein